MKPCLCDWCQNWAPKIRDLYETLPEEKRSAFSQLTTKAICGEDESQFWRLKYEGKWVDQINENNWRELNIGTTIKTKTRKIYNIDSIDYYKEIISLETGGKVYSMPVEFVFGLQMKEN